MKNKIIIKPLNDEELVSVLALPKFENLKPVRCQRCGHKGDFARRIFYILGVPTTKQCDASTQNVITSYIQDAFGLSHVFFKSPNEKFYADSAICPKCQSTRIVYDIELANDLLRMAARITGQSIDETKNGIEATAKRLAISEKRKA
ncbi:MAG: hypothetical protein HY232_09535 [Acidobacteria bacterium]|nr:hypothetical protein [Acidobacteriota bacterium]